MKKISFILIIVAASIVAHSLANIVAEDQTISKHYGACNLKNHDDSTCPDICSKHIRNKRGAKGNKAPQLKETIEVKPKSAESSSSSEGSSEEKTSQESHENNLADDSNSLAKENSRELNKEKSAEKYGDRSGEEKQSSDSQESKLQKEAKPKNEKTNLSAAKSEDRSGNKVQKVEVSRKVKASDAFTSFVSEAKCDQHNERNRFQKCFCSYTSCGPVNPCQFCNGAECHESGSCSSSGCQCNDNKDGNNAYEGVFCEADLNECDSDNGGCSQNCVNLPGDYECSCNPGWELDVDGKTCKDVDECSKGTDNCDDVSTDCVNNVGSYSCACKASHSLRVDDRTCKAAEPTLKEVEDPAPSGGDSSSSGGPGPCFQSVNGGNEVQTQPVANDICRNAGLEPLNFQSVTKWNEFQSNLQAFFPGNDLWIGLSCSGDQWFWNTLEGSSTPVTSDQLGYLTGLSASCNGGCAKWSDRSNKLVEVDCVKANEKAKYRCQSPSCRT